MLEFLVKAEFTKHLSSEYVDKAVKTFKKNMTSEIAKKYYGADLHD